MNDRVVVDDVPHPQAKGVQRAELEDTIGVHQQEIVSREQTDSIRRATLDSHSEADTKPQHAPRAIRANRGIFKRDRGGAVNLHAERGRVVERPERRLHMVRGSLVVTVGDLWRTNENTDREGRTKRPSPRF